MRLIEVENASKVYKARSGPRMLLARGGFVNLFRRRTEHVAALHDISFTVEQGEALGIIGANGSGKSTLLKLLAGVTIPSAGRVTVHGRVASLLELGAGFHPLLTGRENVYLNARILGVDHAHVDAMFDRIVEFSGIEPFIDNPVNTYSSGMFVRLGFAVAVHTDPDVFLVDEVLSVGDEEFQRKCRTRIGELREQGKTIVFVSHDLGIVNTLCTRVILLSKGAMVSRGSPRETIDYYLRQIGRDIGIHTFAGGDVEAILCHGRISVFRNQREVSAAAGFRTSVQYMGQWQESSLAEWVITERSSNGCKARGRMLRLPLSLLWDTRIESDRLIWRIAIECEQEIELQAFSADLFWPPAFTEWLYGEKSGTFPDIAPGDLTWTVLAHPDMTCREAMALPADGAAAHPFIVRLETGNPHCGMLWANTDYVMGSRALQVLAQSSQEAAALPAGRHDLLTIEIDLSLTYEEARARRQAILDQVKARELEVQKRDQERIITSDLVSAKFEAGWVRLSYDGTELTSFIHFYTSMLVNGLWNDSHSFSWHPHERAGERLCIRGDSRRLPFSQYWEITPAGKGIAVRVLLEVRQPLDLLEYHATIVLRPDYTHWETQYESGVYPDFEPGQEDWRHVNRVYNPGRYAKALSSLLPSVTLEVTTDEAPFRMTAINTGYHEQGRVLQALRTSESGQLHFEPGTHLYFEGVISANPDEFHRGK